MTLLEKIKDEYAKELHCQGWIELLMEITIKQEELDVHDEIAKRYAKAVLERAAENAEIDTQYSISDGRINKISCSVKKQSIINTDLG